MIRVALDAMGGDQAPRTEIEGVALALRELPGEFRVQLVGPGAALEAELAQHPELDRSRLDLIEAPEVIGMAEKPLEAIRRKRKSSIAVGLGLQAKGQSDAFISAGNTGALLAASTVLLGLFDGVERASVATLLPTAEGPVLMLDAGANVDCSPRELVGFAHLGTVYMRDILGRPTPRVSLLNIGEEEEKGSAIVKEAHQLLRADRRLNYLGNIEGRDILGGHPRHGRLDVVVCDGFVGNVVLKFYESLMYLVRHLAQSEAPGLWEQKEIRAAFRMLDYSQYGGAPLLGVKGVSIICHGSSNSNAIRHAIRVAVQSVEVQLAKHIGAEFSEREAVEPA
ncbi:MAG TPA: phosphate acyltransferase PlsX [Gemmatimonadales bacterium]|nr:phosphate acyltransferase PlsX [Gemmatimonadales bacterium]